MKSNSTFLLILGFIFSICSFSFGQYNQSKLDSLFNSKEYGQVLLKKSNWSKSKKNRFLNKNYYEIAELNVIESYKKIIPSDNQLSNSLAANPMFNTTKDIFYSMILQGIIPKDIENAKKNLFEILEDEEKQKLKALKIVYEVENYSSDNFLISSTYDKKKPIIIVKSQYFQNQMIDAWNELAFFKEENFIFKYLNPLLINIFEEQGNYKGQILSLTPLPQIYNPQDKVAFLNDFEKIIIKSPFHIYLSIKEDANLLFSLLHESYHLLNFDISKNYNEESEVSADIYALKKMLTGFEKAKIDPDLYSSSFSIENAYLGIIISINESFYKNLILKTISTHSYNSNQINLIKKRFTDFKNISLQFSQNKNLNETQIEKIKESFQLNEFLLNISESYYRLNTITPITKLNKEGFLILTDEENKFQLTFYFFELIKAINLINDKKYDEAIISLLTTSKFDDSKEISFILLGHIYHLAKSDNFQAIKYFKSAREISKLYSMGNYDNLIHSIDNK